MARPSEIRQHRGHLRKQDKVQKPSSSSQSHLYLKVSAGGEQVRQVQCDSSLRHLEQYIGMKLLTNRLNPDKVMNPRRDYLREVHRLRNWVQSQRGAIQRGLLLVTTCFSLITRSIRLFPIFGTAAQSRKKNS